MLCSVASKDDECRPFPRGVTSKVLEVVDNRACNAICTGCQQLAQNLTYIIEDLTSRVHGPDRALRAQGCDRHPGRNREARTGTGIPGMATLLCTRRFCSMDARRGAESIVCWRSLGIASNSVPSRRLSCAAVSASPVPCAYVPIDSRRGIGCKARVDYVDWIHINSQRPTLSALQQRVYHTARQPQLPRCHPSMLNVRLAAIRYDRLYGIHCTQVLAPLAITL